MTPRRPPNARPGTRPGRRGASGPGRAKERETTTARPRRKESEETQPSTAPARVGGEERTMLRVGGAQGMLIPVRALVLLLVLLGAFVITFPSVRGYLAQRAQYDAVVSDLTQAKASATAYEEELAKWQDDNYVRTQARQRLAYVMPGETTYVVVGAQSVEDAAEAAASNNERRRPWYEVLRESSRVAGQAQEEPPSDDPAQQGWSTTAPTVPTPSAPATPGDADASAPSDTGGEP
ncbi:FtsB family cell division protein [Actinomyces oricola]